MFRYSCHGDFQIRQVLLKLEKDLGEDKKDSTGQDATAAFVRCLHRVVKNNKIVRTQQLLQQFVMDFTNPPEVKAAHVLEWGCNNRHHFEPDMEYCKVRDKSDFYFTQAGCKQVLDRGEVAMPKYLEEHIDQRVVPAAVTDLRKRSDASKINLHTPAFTYLKNENSGAIGRRLLEREHASMQVDMWSLCEDVHGCTRSHYKLICKIETLYYFTRPNTLRRRILLQTSQNV